MGYRTDSSGLLTTEVWNRVLAGPAKRNAIVTVIVPNDFVVVDSGIAGKAWPLGSLVYESRHLDDSIDSMGRPTFGQ